MPTLKSRKSDTAGTTKAVKLTKTEVDSIKPRVDKKPLYIYDSELKGFGLRVTGWICIREGEPEDVARG